MQTVWFSVVKETQADHDALGWAGSLCYRVVAQEKGQRDRVVSRHTSKRGAHVESRRLAGSSDEEQARALSCAS